MKAIRIHEYGGPEVLRYEDAPRPEPGKGEVLVRVHAAGVNPIDWKVRGGHLRESLRLGLPWIPGVDFSGVVESVGRGINYLKRGDEVFGKTDLPGDGSYAEYAVVKQRGLAAKPRALDHVAAAALPLAALTAWQSVFGGGHGPGLDLRAGQSLLVLGAPGGVGTIAVQLAKLKDARVYGTARGPEDVLYLQSLGIDRVVDLARQQLEEAGEVDAVLDLVGGDLQQRAWALVRPGGAMASTVGGPSEQEAMARGARAIGVLARTNASQLAEIAGLVDTGRLKVLVGEELPLEAAPRAHARLASGEVRGKLVLGIAS